MIREFFSALREAGYYVMLALRGLCFWRREPPIRSTEDLIRFVETRSKFVTQITLFGYLKTRAGTRYTSLFEDDLFAQSINIAKWEIYLAALSDLTVHVAARVGKISGAQSDEIQFLALSIHQRILSKEEIPKEKPQGFEAASRAFEERITDVPWLDMAEGEDAFRGSLDALVEWAPVAPELKDKDTIIIMNSMRFRWKAVRDQLTELLDADSIITAWRAAARSGGGAEAEGTAAQAN